jgi:hypothetical protein
MDWAVASKNGRQKVVFCLLNNRFFVYGQECSIAGNVATCSGLFGQHESDESNVQELDDDRPPRS